MSGLDELRVLEKVFENFVYEKNDLFFKFYRPRRHRPNLHGYDMTAQHIYSLAELTVGESRVIPTIDLVEGFSQEPLRRCFSDESEMKNYIGPFISALSNLTVKDKNRNTINLDLGNLGEKIYMMGCFLRNVNLRVKSKVGKYAGAYMNSGKLIIEGDAGDQVGSYMNGGKIEVLGNTGNLVGDKMQDGEIEIHGNAGDLVGHDMENGAITIRGNVGHDVGYYMTNGRINLRSGRKLVAPERYGGEIYCRGTLVKRETPICPRTFEEFIKEQEAKKKEQQSKVKS